MKKLPLLLTLFFFAGTALLFASEVPTMSKDELKSRLGSNTVVILDVRTGRDWISSEFKIEGAVRAPGDKISQWSKNYTKEQTLVLYCA